MAPPTRTEPIRIIYEILLIDRRKNPRQPCLHQLILKGGYAQGTFLATPWFGNIYPAYWQRDIGHPVQFLDQSRQVLFQA